MGNIKVEIYQTSKDTDYRLKKVEEIIMEEKTNSTSKIVLDPTKEYQKMIGFGGAFTEAGGYVLSQISEEKQQEIIEKYFDSKNGLNYTFCRTHMNSCDFSLGNYAYTETLDDVELKDFSIERDHEYLLPFIKKALKKSDNDLKIFASPWSPPAWMKTNGRMNKGGSLKAEYEEVWAKYYARYIKEYKKEGVDIWGLSIQNEPMAETPWDNCIYTSERERDFVKVLGPVLKEEGLEDIKIIVWDHNKDIMKERVDTILGDDEAAKWVWGVGFHWYGEDDTKSIVDDEVLDYTHEKYGKNLVFTEGCNPLFDEESFVGEWWTGEKYGRHIMADLNHWTVAWTDWNMILDEKGGPNHVNNYCDAPIIVDTKKGEIHYNSPYYYMGHFSKFILPGAVRIGLESNIKNLQQTSFKNENGDIVLVIMNEGKNKESFEVEIYDKTLKYEIPAHSIITMKMELQNFDF